MIRRCIASRLRRRLHASENISGAASLAPSKIWRRQYRPTRCYLRVHIVFESPSTSLLNSLGFQAMVAETLQSNFGVCGAAQCKWSLVSFDDVSGVGILRVQPEGFSRLRFALSLVPRCGGRRCRIDCLAAAPSLAALSCGRFGHASPGDETSGNADMRD